MAPKVTSLNLCTSFFKLKISIKILTCSNVWVFPRCLKHGSRPGIKKLIFWHEWQKYHLHNLPIRSYSFSIVSSILKPFSAASHETLLFAKKNPRNNFKISIASCRNNKISSVSNVGFVASNHSYKTKDVGTFNSVLNVINAVSVTFIKPSTTGFLHRKLLSNRKVQGVDDLSLTGCQQVWTWWILASDGVVLGVNGSRDDWHAATGPNLMTHPHHTGLALPVSNRLAS